MPSAAETDRRPLTGLRVVEVSSFVAAPLGGMTLAQLGADVIRVDPLGGAADRFRWPLSRSGTSLYWAGLNKGKRSMMVDLRSAEGRAIVTELVAACPPATGVVLTNAVGQEWLSADALAAACPDLIHVLVQGRNDGTPAVDYTVNAESGFPTVTGPAGLVDPVNHVLPAWDIACGLYAALGVSAAARRREITGEGDQVRVALTDVALAMAGNLGLLAEAQLDGVARPRIGNHLYGGFARDFCCADGERVMVVTLSARHWRDLVQLTGMAEPVAALERSLGVDFAAETDRYDYREVLAGLFQRWFAARPLGPVSAALATTSLLWAPYRTFGQVVAHLETAAGANDLMSVVDQPGVGRYLAPGSPLRFASTPGEVRPAPAFGANTAQILAADLGYDPDRIDDLLGRAVVATEPLAKGRLT